MARYWAVAGMIAAVVYAAPVAHAQGHDEASAIHGIWRNPKNSVHVDIRPCGSGVCGYVVWASEKAKKDALEGGTASLVGMQLFRNFVLQQDGVWRGKVFVPDLNGTFSGTAKLVDSSTVKARGCLFANILCKSQTWRRVDAPTV